jgi:integrase
MIDPASKSLSNLAVLHRVFEDWCGQQRLTGRLRHASSEAVYRAMWHALAAWCVVQTPPLRLNDLRALSLTAYLASRSGNAGPDQSLTARYQWRLLSLVQRVQAHHADQLRRPAPTAAAELIAAQPEVRNANAADAKALPEHLSASDLQRLLTLLASEAPAAMRWQDQRDRCAAALQLGAGLGPGDLRALRLADVVPAAGPALPWQLRIPANGSAPLHIAPIADWSATLLAAWLQKRQALAGDWLFPSTRSGKPWGKVAQYEAAQRVLADAGLEPAAGGSFRLRHSFALRQLQHGITPDQLSRWLGVIDPAVMTRYQRVLGPISLPADSPACTGAGRPV